MQNKFQRQLVWMIIIIALLAVLVLFRSYLLYYFKFLLLLFLGVVVAGFWLAHKSELQSSSGKEEYSP